MRDICVQPPPLRAVIDRDDAPASLTPAKPLPGWAGLWEWFYLRRNLPRPRLEALDGNKVPQPYRRLLVHSSDMTPTLEGFYRQPVGLRILSRDLHEDTYLREVILLRGKQGPPIAYGMIRIFLAHMPPAASRRVLKEQHPLGHILQTEAIPHLSWPQAFFRTEPDPHIIFALDLRRGCHLYGRRNVLLDGSRRLLAEVIEVLAPADGVDSTEPVNSNQT